MTEFISQFNITDALFGGVLIGLSATFLMLFLGRIAGVSGIIFSLFSRETLDKSWRLLFLVGMMAGAALIHPLLDIPVPKAPDSSLTMLIAGGLIVGFGTSLGSGCTSGHGVCGISRLSLRSIVATLTFMASGFVIVYVFRHQLGLV